MQKHEWAIDDCILESEVERRDAEFTVTVGGKFHSLTSLGNGLFATVIDGHKRIVAAVRDRDKYLVDINAIVYEITEPSASSGVSLDEGHGAKDKVYAPMPGKIVKLLVKVGDQIVEKQPLVIVEAMKMENQVTAKAQGKVKAVNFAEGDQVDTERPIIELELTDIVHQ